MRWFGIVAPVVTAAVALASCRGRDDLDGKRRPPAGISAPGLEHSLAADEQLVVLDFYDHRAAAVVHAGGALVMDCGTADFTKYVEGAYQSPWVIAVEDSGVRASLVPGLGAELYFPLDGDPGGVRRERDGGLRIQFRARAAKKQQLVSVFLNEVALGDVAMPGTDWQWYSIEAPAAAVRHGENKLRFYFRHAGEINGERTAAAFARITVGRTPAKSAAVALQSGPVTHAGLRMNALHVLGPARISYFLSVPTSRPALMFAAAGPATDIAVQVAGPSSSSATQVWTGSAGERWQETRIDLSAYEGEIVRVDFSSSGAVAWGRPQLLGGSRPTRKSPPAGKGASAAGATSRLADHVIVWVVASLRDDRFAGSKVPTPGFARIADRGTRFVSALSVSPSPGAAHVALLTGTYPRASRIDERGTTLAERFRQAGFTTALISGNGFVNDEAGFAKGFEVYRNPLRKRHPHSARILWQHARRLLDRHRDGHAFIYMATSEPHLQYNPTAASLAEEWNAGPARFEPAATAQLSVEVRRGTERLSQEERAYLRALYDAEVRDASAAFSTMLSDIDKLGLADRTAIIVVGDHGEELFERGNFGHGSHLYQEVLHVPLVVVPPGSTAGTTVRSDVELIDVYATALELAGIAVNPESQGRSLLSLSDAASESSVRASLMPNPVTAALSGWGRALKLGRFKLLVHARGAHELYDLHTDPGEQVNLMGTRPFVERYLRNVFGFAIGYRNVWSRRRWGPANAVSAAFAGDQGL